MKKVLFILAVAGSTSAIHAMDVVAHRGEPRLAPENTVEGITLAYKIGAKWAETDLNYTKSGEIVVMHMRDELKKLWGIDKPVEEITPADRTKSQIEMKDWWTYKKVSKIPTVEEVFKCIPPDRFLECEIKIYSPDFAKVFDDARKAAGVKVSQIAVIGFSTENLADFHSKYPEYTIRYVCFAADKKGMRMTAEQAIANAKKCGASQISIGGFMYIDKSYVDKIKAAGLRANFWCVDTEEHLAKAVECGVDAITTNRADYLKKNLPVFKSVGAVELK